MTEPVPLESSITPFLSLLTFTGRVFGRSLSRVALEGAVDQIPREGPVILAANHASNLDAIEIGAWLIPGLGRRIHWLGKKELFAWPIVGWTATHGGVHPVDRGGADVEAFRLAQRILDEGQILFVFPEGTRSPTAELQPPKDGLAMLALRSGATIVPIGISNTDRFWPKGRLIPRPGGHVTMRVGEPFKIADLLPPELDRKSAKRLATTLVMRRIAALLDPRHRGPYAADEG
jgi:1-acyl-sn-glycerol-3-phosphate acyltransferase